MEPSSDGPGAMTAAEPDQGAVLYAETYLARVACLGVPVIGVPGMQGVRLAHDLASVRLLVIDDRAFEELVDLLPSVRTGRIAVFGQAGRCVEAVEDRLGWTSTTTTSMTLAPLPAGHATALPDGVTLLAVDEHSSGRRDAVTMEQAVAVAALADPVGVGDPGVLARDLTASMPAFRFFAALDATAWRGRRRALASSGHGRWSSSSTPTRAGAGVVSAGR